MFLLEMADAVVAAVEESEGKKDVEIAPNATKNNNIDCSPQKQPEEQPAERSSLSRKTNDDDMKPPPAKKFRIQLDTGPSVSNAERKSNKNSRRLKFIYGNYNRYYSNRIQEDEEDVRMDAFKQHAHLFINKDVCDIGCNNGMVTIAVARDVGVKTIIGLDIDKELIGAARKQLAKLRSEKSNNNQRVGFPFNIAFKQCNYVLDHEVLLDLVTDDFDTILCLSVTKWIHLNFGDPGLKLAFKRMYKQLRQGGHLILEAQSWVGYKRRKTLTPEITKNFKSITMRPDKFREYLLSPEIGFTKCIVMEVPDHRVKGFQRPVQIFIKGEKLESHSEDSSNNKIITHTNGNVSLLDNEV